ncbi:MAG: DUF5785 family protein [Halorhabdus sp.]
MNWPHDPDGETGSEGRRKYGQAIIAKKVDSSDFPIAVDAFVEEYGDHPVRIDHERIVSVAEVFEHVEADTLDDFPAFHTAVGEAMRDAGYWPLELDHA